MATASLKGFKAFFSTGAQKPVTNQELINWQKEDKEGLAKFRDEVGAAFPETVTP